jgi:hypothetical protein
VVGLTLPAALWGLLLLPVVVLLRLLARRPRVLVVPSLIPWRAAAGASASPRRRALLVDLPLALQLAAVAAAVLAAAGPELRGSRSAGRRVAVVIDNSASMAARAATAGGPTRLEHARARLREELGRLGEYHGALWVTSPRPLQLAGPDASRAEVEEALFSVAATAAGGDLAGALGGARRAAGAEALPIVAGDDLGALGEMADEELILVRVGAPAGNLGIVAAAVEPPRAFCAVRNAGLEPRRAAVTMTVGGETKSAEKDVAPGARAEFTFELPAELEGFVELKLEPGGDDLAADDAVRLAAGRGPRPVLLAAAGRAAGSTLRALAALGFPAPVEIAGGALPEGSRLVVACGLWPPELPAGAFALVVAPPHAGGFEFDVERASGLDPGPGGLAVMRDAGGERALIALSADRRACVLAFDPEGTGWVGHPSFPVFFERLTATVPALAAVRRAFYRTGEPAPGAFAGRLTAPGGATVRPGEPLREVGVYRAGGRPAFAANLLNEKETACPVAGSSVRRVRPSGAGRVGERTALAPWLFALALLALAAEWLLAWRGVA